MIKLFKLVCSFLITLTFIFASTVDVYASPAGKVSNCSAARVRAATHEILKKESEHLVLKRPQHYKQYKFRKNGAYGGMVKNLEVKIAGVKTGYGDTFTTSHVIIHHANKHIFTDSKLRGGSYTLDAKGNKFVVAEANKAISNQQSYVVLHKINHRSGGNRGGDPGTMPGPQHTNGIHTRTVEQAHKNISSKWVDSQLRTDGQGKYYRGILYETVPSSMSVAEFEEYTGLKAFRDIYLKDPNGLEGLKKQSPISFTTTITPIKIRESSLHSNWSSTPNWNEEAIDIEFDFFSPDEAKSQFEQWEKEDLLGKKNDEPDKYGKGYTFQTDGGKPRISWRIYMYEPLETKGHSLFKDPDKALANNLPKDTPRHLEEWTYDDVELEDNERVEAGVQDWSDEVNPESSTRR